MDNPASINQSKQKTPFSLNRIKVDELGFNLASEEKLYEQLACPFDEDISKGHPLNAKYPQNFLTSQFNIQKVAPRLSQEVMFYIFYNVMDQRLQMMAARTLMNNKYRYNKQDKIWVRKVEGRFEYFSLVEWKHMQYTGAKSGDMFCTQADFAEK